MGNKKAGFDPGPEKTLVGCIIHANRMVCKHHGVRVSIN